MLIKKLAVCSLGTLALTLANAIEVGQWEVFETSFETGKQYTNPYTDVEANVTFTQGDKRWTMPAFWGGGGTWTVRFAPPAPGQYKYQVECSDRSNTDLEGKQGSFRAVTYGGRNRLLEHGFLRISTNNRHFEYADGTPFFWLGDTWWKGLAKRLTWEGFQELTADRKAKGFTVIQLVCGRYPDEGYFETRWENEGGKPYTTKDFTMINPAYFKYADRRIKHLVDSGIVPAIVGGWGRADCNSLEAGVPNIKRHWRNLVARYGAYPTIWIIGGESSGPDWTDIARYVRQIDPYERPVTVHPIDSGRTSMTDESVINFDMLQTGHGDWQAARKAIPKFRAAYERKPPVPVMIGEYCYEGHMQTAFEDVQRYVFWAAMLSGAAGHTYGAAGVWHMSVEGDPGITPVYDLTTWKEGMNFPGSTQLGLGKKLLESYPWFRFEPHSDWAEEEAFAAGIPGELRFIYLPNRAIYNWNGLLVKNLEKDVAYEAFYFDPARGRRFNLRPVIRVEQRPNPFEGHTGPRLFSDQFEEADGSAWKDYGTPTQRTSGRLAGGKGVVSVVNGIDVTNAMASVDARNDAEAGIILRFRDADNYVVALYSPSLKKIFIHDRKNGNWGEQIAPVDVPDIGPDIRLTAAVCGEYAALAVADGKKTYSTPVVEIGNRDSGKVGLWFYHIGDRQQFDNFEVSGTQFTRSLPNIKGQVPHLTWTGDWQSPRLPSPQDWVLVLKRAE